MTAKVFQKELEECVSVFVNKVKKHNPCVTDVEIYMNEGGLTLRYESDETCYYEEVAEINGKLCGLHFSTFSVH